MCGVVCELNSVCAVAENVRTCVLKVCERVCEFNSMCVCVGTVCVVCGKITTDRQESHIKKLAVKRITRYLVIA